MNHREEIIKFFEAHIEEFVTSGGGGSSLPEIVVELTPRDFLDFAESDLEEAYSERKLVNAMSNLKRAVDCQLDSFLVHLNLYDFFQKRRLGVDRKLGFVEKTGVFHARSLEKLNKMRNRLEHHYEIPKIEDVEVYYDLVVAFVSVIENTLPLVGGFSNIHMEIKTGGNIRTFFEYETPSIEIVLEHNKLGYKKTFASTISKDIDPIAMLEEFAFYFRVHMVLRMYDEGIFSIKHAINVLKK